MATREKSSGSLNMSKGTNLIRHPIPSAPICDGLCQKLIELTVKLVKQCKTLLTDKYHGNAPYGILMTW
ncbi:hypothetical protein ACTXT7_002306 [Hymenolepis weldensis]